MILFNFILVFILLISVFLVIHSYILYPILLKILASFKKTKHSGFCYMPKVSILCSAYNEEKVISERVKNVLEQNYDLDKIEFILGSDCSDDRTNEILLDLAKQHSWLKVRIFNIRGGKATVINNLVKEASNDILVFTDANTVFDRNAIRMLVQDFEDSHVGGISGRLILNEPSVNKTESNEEKKYWDYEISTKISEGNLGVLIGANGGIFAIRKKYFREIPTERAVTDDLFISLCVLSNRAMFNYCFDAYAVEEIGKNVSLEINRKIRFAATNYQTIQFFKDLLFSRNFLISFAFWSHKIIRWFTPFLMIASFVSNLLLVNQGVIFESMAILQVVFYLFACVGAVFSLKKIRITIFSVPFFFVASNYALLVGFFRFMQGKHSVIWQSTPR